MESVVKMLCLLFFFLALSPPLWRLGWLPLVLSFFLSFFLLRRLSWSCLAFVSYPLVRTRYFFSLFLDLWEAASTCFLRSSNFFLKASILSYPCRFWYKTYLRTHRRKERKDMWKTQGRERKRKRRTDWCDLDPVAATGLLCLEDSRQHQERDRETDWI